MYKKLFILLLILLLWAGNASAQASQNITLKSGFNFISFSVSITSTPAELKAFNSAIEDIYLFSAAAGSFIQVVRDGSGTPVKIDGVDPSFAAGDSYFINLSEDTLINMTALMY